MSPFTMLGDPEALVCEGDSCLVPAAVAQISATTPASAPAGDASGSAAHQGAGEA